MKKLNVFLLLLLLSLPLGSYAAVWPISGTATSDSIGSDYGPRNVSSGSAFHYGVDIFVNTVPVKSITATTITAVALSGGATGNYVQTTNGFRYLHLSPKTSGYEIRKGFDDKGKFLANYIVFKDSSGSIIKVLSSESQAADSESDRYWYDHDNDKNTKNIKESMAAKNSLSEGETFAYSGNSGKSAKGKSYPYHLHLDKGNKGPNPLRDLPYTASPSTISLIKPTEDKVKAGKVPIVVEVNSASDFDLNEVTVSIDGIEQFHPIIDKPVGPNNDVSIRKDDKKTGVHPISNGVDRFIYIWKASAKAECTPPTGKHTIKIIAFAALILISSRTNLQFSWSRTIL